MAPELPEPRILLFGSNGPLGRELLVALTGVGRATPLDRRTAEFGNPKSFRGIVREQRPQLIIEAAASTGETMRRATRLRRNE